MAYEKLDKRFKTKWIKALQSKEYPKGEYKLVTSDGKFCCLGVCGAICGLNIEDMRNIGTINRKSGLKGISKVPKQLVGTGFTNPIVDKLVTLNDTSKTFKPVITWIEKNL